MGEGWGIPESLCRGCPGRTDDAKVGASQGWNWGSPCIGHPGRMAEIKVGVNWGILACTEGALVGAARAVAGCLPGRSLGALCKGQPDRSAVVERV